MQLTQQTEAARRGRHRDARGQRGSATLVILMALFLMTVFALSNNRVLDLLQKDVRLLEERHERYWHEQQQDAEAGDVFPSLTGSPDELSTADTVAEPYAP